MSRLYRYPAKLVGVPDAPANRITSPLYPLTTTTSPTLLVLLGPTGVGKTALSLRLAEHLGSPILSADSRQIYRGMPIGTAAPTADERARVTHYFVDLLDPAEPYSAACYETDALALLTTLFTTHATVLLTGGSMMYIDAVCQGIDDIPTVPTDIRAAVLADYGHLGLDALLDELRQADPVHFAEVDRRNLRRVIHAVEICRTAGRPYSDFRTRTVKVRPFRILKIGLVRPREELFHRIDARVDQMMDDGLLREARALYPQRHLNALNTVGYKELFQHFDGQLSLDEAVARIKRNTRVYARKQQTWFRRDPSITWFHPDDTAHILRFLDEVL